MSLTDKMKLIDDIEVVINLDCYQKIMHWVNMSNFEVSGFGKVQNKDGKLIVTSVTLLKQENSTGSTDIEGEAIAKAMYELRDEPGDFNFWWHSHVNMSVFWSETDTDAIASIGKNGWVLASVFNKKNEILSLYYQNNNNNLPAIVIDEIPTTIDYSIKNKELEKELTTEYKDKVTNKIFEGKFDSSKYILPYKLPHWMEELNNKSSSKVHKGYIADQMHEELEKIVASYEHSNIEEADKMDILDGPYTTTLSQHRRMAKEFNNRKKNKHKNKNR